MNEAIKSLVPQSPKRKAVPPPPSKKKQLKETDSKKIQKLKQEYAKLKQVKEANEDDEFDPQLETIERTLGQLQVKRVSKTNVDDIMSYDERHLR